MYFPPFMANHFGENSPAPQPIRFRIPDTGDTRLWLSFSADGRGSTISLKDTLSCSVYAMNSATFYPKTRQIPAGKVLTGVFGRSVAVVRNTEPVSATMNFEIGFYAIRAFGLWYAANGWRRELSASLETYNVWTRRVEAIAVVEIRRTAASELEAKPGGLEEEA